MYMFEARGHEEEKVSVQWTENLENHKSKNERIGTEQRTNYNDTRVEATVCVAESANINFRNYKRRVRRNGMKNGLRMMKHECT